MLQQRRRVALYWTADQLWFSAFVALGQVNAEKVSAARRNRSFFSQEWPSEPLQESTTIPLTIKDFIVAQEGLEKYKEREWSEVMP